jgi:orotidine-5'-phosphate decarboxylase
MDDHDRVRSHLALALDVADLDTARALGAHLAPWFAVAKVGLELYTAVGPAAVTAMRDDGFAVFADLKLHDIPSTVGRAAAAAGRLGVDYLTVHAAGGERVLSAAVEGLGGTAAGARVLAVTVLTSEPEAPAGMLAQRVDLAVATGCGGVVCAARDLGVVSPRARGLKVVVPGVRLAGTAADDQARVATPGEALAAGADLLVVGRTVTAATDPGAAARSVAGEVAAALGAARPK